MDDIDDIDSIDNIDNIDNKDNMLQQPMHLCSVCLCESMPTESMQACLHQRRHGRFVPSGHPRQHAVCRES